jgi:hypothetical protein
MAPPENPDFPGRYSGRDFLEDSLRQMQELERARAEWQARFLADCDRMREWQP